MRGFNPLKYCFFDIIIVNDEDLRHILRYTCNKTIKDKIFIIVHTDQYLKYINDGIDVPKPMVEIHLMLLMEGVVELKCSSTPVEPYIFGFIRSAVATLKVRLEIMVDNKLDTKVATIVNPRFDTLEYLIGDRFFRY